MHIGDETFNGNICSSMILSRDMTNTIEEWPREVEQSLLFHGVPVPDNESFYTKVGDDDGGGDDDGDDDGDDYYRRGHHRHYHHNQMFSGKSCLRDNQKDAGHSQRGDL